MYPAFGKFAVEFKPVVHATHVIFWVMQPKSRPAGTGDMDAHVGGAMESPLQISFDCVGALDMNPSVKGEPPTP